MLRPQVCVEIGAFTGSSILPVAATLKYLNHGKVIAIDAWSNTEATNHLANDDPNKTWWSGVDMKKVYERFQNMITQWSLQPFCTVIQSTSAEAITKVDDIDFLHLDGNYSEISSVQDVKNYLPRVKKGGYILLSNLFVTVNNKQPKMRAFCILYEECELVCEIEKTNAVLFRKM